jgi:hypothetical protein
MELIVKLAWLVLALIHLMPSMVLFRPAMIQSLYGIEPGGPIALLLVHRGALFLAVLAACIIALFHAPSRPLAATLAAISMLSFLWLYAKAGMPLGGLRKIALVDAIGLPFLAIVVFTSLKVQLVPT